MLQQPNMIKWDVVKQTLSFTVIVFHRKRVLTVLQEMLGLAQTPPSLVFLLTEKLLSLIPDDQRRIQTVGCLFRQPVFHSFVAFHPTALSPVFPRWQRSSPM